MHGDYLQGLPDSLAVNSVSWKKIFDSLEPDRATLPEPWRSDLTSFQKIVTLRILRPDKIIPALTSFVAESLGRRFVEPKPFAIEPSYNDSSCSTPLICVLYPGRSVALFSCPLLLSPAKHSSAAVPLPSVCYALGGQLLKLLPSPLTVSLQQHVLLALLHSSYLRRRQSVKGDMYGHWHIDRCSLPCLVRAELFVLFMLMLCWPVLRTVGHDC